jgi:hypothetical protein
MGEDINYRMCKAEMTTDIQLRKEVAENLINEFLVDPSGRSVDKAVYDKYPEGLTHNRDDVDYTARSFYGTFQLEAVAHCANDVRRDATQVHYMYDASGHFVYIAGSENSNR